MTNLLALLLIAASGIISAEKCHFLPVPESGVCQTGCYIAATKRCAVNCPYKIDATGNCVKEYREKFDAQMKE